MLSEILFGKEASCDSDTWLEFDVESEEILFCFGMW